MQTAEEKLTEIEALCQQLAHAIEDERGKDWPALKTTAMLYTLFRLFPEDKGKPPKRATIDGSVTPINKIGQFWHCEECLEEKPEDQSPEEWARLSVGATETGFQVWCVRHDMNVAVIEYI